MKEMMTSEDFADVTLVSDDKKTIKAHKSILSACSPVFKNILHMESQNSHPVIYLRGIQYPEIESILQFMYLGEAKFYEERMNEFIMVAKNLEIKELSKGIEFESSKSQKDPPEETIEQSEENLIDSSENDDLDDSNMTAVSEADIVDDNEQREISKLASHMSKFQCPKCDKTFSFHSELRYHKTSLHEGVKYACNQCNYQAIKQSHLKQHIQSKHEGVKYACNQCD